jgi:quercetin 2,3-dioxygenase
LSHSEYNHSKTEPANTLQIWVFPKEKNIKPRYDQKDFGSELTPNKLVTLVSPDTTGGAIWINQDATFSMGDFEPSHEFTYEVKQPGNGVYIFVIDGAAKVEDSMLNKKDALGVYDTSSLTIITEAASRLLFIEVPMAF